MEYCYNDLLIVTNNCTFTAHTRLYETGKLPSGESNRKWENFGSSLWCPGMA